MAQQLKAKQIPAAYARGTELMKAGKLREAHALFAQIVKLKPRTAEAHWQIGRIALRIGDDGGAVRALEKAQRLKPREVAVLRDLAAALSRIGDGERLVAVLRRLLDVKPSEHAARMELAIALQTLGAFEEAETELRRVLAARPENGVAWRLIAAGRKIGPGDPLIGEMRVADRDGTMPPAQRASLDFALAKALEDSGAHEEVIPLLKRGNDALARLHPYDGAARAREVAALKAAFEGVDFSQPVLEPDPGFAPVYVTGIPRSGTTLGEQIVGAHSRATAIGEAREFGQVVQQFLALGDGSFRPLGELGRDQLLAMRRRLEELLRRRFAFGAVCVDKSVQNWHYIGLIRYLMPNARVIVMRRDPRDNLLSIYKNVFAEGAHRYAYRFDDMVDYLKSHHEMLAFWRDAAPGLFAEVSYEALVNDPEPRARALVAAAGLEWEGRCLEFYKQKQRVSTLSLAQVRQPIYKSSTRAWERYGDEVAPLIQALKAEGLLPDGA